MIAKYTGIVFISEMTIDCVKHYFITRLNNLNSELYNKFKAHIFFRIFQRMLITNKFSPNLESKYKEVKAMLDNNKGEKEIAAAFENFNWSLNYIMFDFESTLAMSANCLILP